MFGLIRILLLLVIIAAVALLIRPDLIEMTGLAGSKLPQSKEQTASTPVAEQQVSVSATTAETDSPKPVEQTAGQTAEKATEKAPTSENIAPEETDASQESDTTTKSDPKQESAPVHDQEMLKQSNTEWGFDGSQEADSAPQSTPSEEISSPQEVDADTASEINTPQQSAPAHDPETLKQSDAEWGFDGSQETTPDTDNAVPEASETPQESDSGTSDSTPDEAALRQRVEELQALAADIIDNPE